MAKFIKIGDTHYRVDGIREISVYAREWGHRTVAVTGTNGTFCLFYSKDAYDNGEVDRVVERIKEEAV